MNRFSTLFALAALFLVACDDGPPGRGAQLPSSLNYWFADEGTSWLFEADSSVLTEVLRVDVNGTATVGGQEAIVLDWYMGLPTELWPPSSSAATPFQTSYWQENRYEGVMYLGREDDGNGDAWGGAALYTDPPVVFASDEIRYEESIFTESGGTIWNSTVVQLVDVQTRMGNYNSLEVSFTTDTGGLSEVGTYWLAVGKGLIAFENDAYLEGDPEPARVRWLLKEFIDGGAQ